MAAFDVTTRPTSLSLKPGSTGSIMVVVSNRLGRPIMGLVEGVLTPGPAARWLVPPPDLQRRYEADPAATANYEFKVAVPKDAPAQAVQFRATVRDVLAPDDTRVEGQTVAINITPDAVTPTTGKKKLPWWVWLIAGLVVVGVGIGIILAVTKKGNDCKSGYVWRQANKEDHVCVTPATHKETLEENELADDRRSPTGGAYGPNTCLQGFVWREAYPGDQVCVVGSSRARAAEDNAQAAERKKP
jgi:peroxiredoxin